MKKLFLFLILAISLGATSQGTIPAYSTIKLTKPVLGTKNDSVIVRNNATGGVLKILPVSEIKGTTNLDYTASPTGGTVFSSTGNDAVLPLATSVNAGLQSPADKSKLDGIANYTHPANHPPSIITQDSSNRFVTDTEKATWNAKQGALGFTPENSANKNTANGYAGLGSDGKLISSQLPSITISDTFVTASQAAMLALTAETGDVAVRTDLNKSFILKGTNPTVLGDWQELLTSTSAVTTVFGRNGAVTAQNGDYNADQITETANRKFQTANQNTFNDATSSIQTQLNAKQATIATGTTAQYYRGDKTWQTLDKTTVGLGNVDNTSDLNKPISTATQTALNGKQASLGFTPYNSTNPAGYISSYTETDPNVPAYSKSLSAFSVIKSSTDAIYEPLFSKNTAFNKNFGTSAGTVAEGNDSRINNGQTAFGWGNHAGLYRPIGYIPSWSEITSKPTTVSAFGITDAFTATYLKGLSIPSVVGGTDVNTISSGLVGNYGSGSYWLNTPTNSFGMVETFEDYSGLPIKQQTFYDIRHASTDYADVWNRQYNTLGWTGWSKMLHSNNYNQYSPKLDGTGASGTWGINIGGSSVKWDNQAYYGSTSITTPLYIMTYDGNDNIWKPALSNTIKFFLGLGSNAYTSTSYQPADGFLYTYKGVLGSNINANDLSANSIYLNVTGNGSGNSNFPSSYSMLSVMGNNDTYGQVQHDYESNGTQRVRIKYGGTFGAWRKVWDDGNFNPASYLPLTGGTVTGNITATGFFNSSDRRLKNILKRDGDVAYFTWKDKRDAKTHIGYIAQEVKKEFPDQVNADEKGNLSVNYIEILVEKIRKLEKEIELLKAK